MANYQELKQAIADVIKTNGNQEITGAILQNVLKSMVSVIGENATFAGIAIPSTNPGTPDANVFYIAAETGSYPNFGSSKKVTDNEIAIFNLEHGYWSKHSIPVIKTSRAAQIEAQQNYLFASATSRDAYIVATGYYQALIDAYIPLTPVAGAKYYLTGFNRTSRDFNLYYTTTGAITGNTAVYSFTEDTTYGDYTLMKTKSNNNAWVIIDWNKMVDDVGGYHEGMELNPCVFKNPNYDSLLAMINTANSNISDINSDISEINGSINKKDSAIDALINKLGLTYSGFTLKETLPGMTVSASGETYTSYSGKSTVLKLSTGLEDGTASIFLKFNAFNIANAYYAIKGHDGEKLKAEKPSQVNAEISFTGEVSEIWIVVSSDDTSYSGYVLSGDISIDIPPTDFSGIINTVISEDTLTGLLVANMRVNLKTGALQASNMFSYYEYVVPKGALKVKTKLTTFPNCGLGFYDEGGTYISGLNATTAEGGGAASDYNGRYYEVDIPSGAASLINSVETTEGTGFTPYSAGDMTFIFDNLEMKIQEQIDAINEKIQPLPNKVDVLEQSINASKEGTGIAYRISSKFRLRPLKILGVGNSWTNNATVFLGPILSGLGVKVEINVSYAPGATLQSYWDNINSNTAAYQFRKWREGQRWIEPDTNSTYKDILLSDDWDILTHQQQSGNGGNYPSFQPYLHDIINWEKSLVKVMPLFFMHATWAYPNGYDNEQFETLYGGNTDTMYNAILGAYNQAMTDEGIVNVMPSALMIQKVRTLGIPDIDTPDGGSHLSTNGLFAVACVWAEMIFRNYFDQSVASELSIVNSTYNPNASALSDEKANAIRNLAKEIVENVRTYFPNQKVL